MKPFSPETVRSIQAELELLFRAHASAGLKGKMCLYTAADQKIWRAGEAGFQHWFSAEEIPGALATIQKHYNNGNLPNTPLLLHPIIHEVQKDGTLKALGSGVIWATGFCMGVAELKPEQSERLHDLGIAASPFHRGENERAGLKMLAFSKTAIPAGAGAIAVAGCRETYSLANIESPEYGPYYLLSGLSYLCAHGLFGHPDLADMNHGKPLLEPAAQDAFIKAHQLEVAFLEGAAKSWEAYDRHHSLFKKFGPNPERIENNLKFYNLCARDISLFDATGAKHVDADTKANFDFIVEGWIPKGAVTVIGASGGTGKSSLAHNLAVKAAIDYAPGEDAPTWLGSKIHTDQCKGIIVYFSGEDGPAIVHSRSKVFDPEGRSERLMFQRTDFGECKNISEFLQKLQKLEHVPLVVIDPARKYLTGDEDDAGVVSEFFEAIEEFAIRKHAAVVVVHHLAKGARPKHVSDIYDMLRGSQVFIDRPRVVIGMYRDGPHTVAGLAKNNIPPQMGMIQGERVFSRNEAKLELVQLPGAKGIRKDNFAAADE